MGFNQNEEISGTMGEDRTVQAILFDSDNTLYDFKSAQSAACDAVIAYTGIGNAENLDSYFILNPFKGGNHLILTYYLNDIGISDDEILENAWTIYTGIKLEKTILFDGVYETLEQLRKRKILLGIVSNAPLCDLCPSLEKTNIRKFFQCIVTADEANAKKPSLSPFGRALSFLSTKPGNSLMVGDNIINDLVPAKKLGMKTILFNCWTGNQIAPSERQDVDYAIKEFGEILTILDNYRLS